MSLPPAFGRLICAEAGKGKGVQVLTLYMIPGSSSMAPHIALNEAGAAFEIRPVSMARNEQRSAEFLALNPEGKVPVLLVDGRPLTETAAILFYIARRFPEARLIGEGLEAEAEAVSWMSFIASTLQLSRRKGMEEVGALYRIVDRRLAGRRWATGDYSIADIHLFRVFWRFMASRKPDLAALPNLVAHYERMLARPAVQRTLEAEAGIGYDDLT